MSAASWSDDLVDEQPRFCCATAAMGSKACFAFRRSVGVVATPRSSGSDQRPFLECWRSVFLPQLWSLRSAKHISKHQSSSKCLLPIMAPSGSLFGRRPCPSTFCQIGKMQISSSLCTDVPGALYVRRIHHRSVQCAAEVNDATSMSDVQGAERASQH